MASRIIFSHTQIVVFSTLVAIASSTNAKGPTPGLDPVKNVSVIKESGGRVSWGPGGDLFALDLKGQDGYYDVYVMRPGGSSEQCLTCNKRSGVGQKHNGTPEWHPSGKYLVFTSEKQRHPGGSLFAKPGVGLYNDS